MKKNIIVMTALLICAGCNQKYDKNIWAKNEHQNADNPRFDMTDDLMKNYLLKGMNPGKVLDLLDKPKYIDTTESAIHWTYAIGSNTGFHIDLYYLVIDFDTTGNLSATHIVSH